MRVSTLLFSLCYLSMHGAVLALTPQLAFMQRSQRRADFAATTLMGTHGDHDPEWFQQRSGESDTAFIKRLTSQAPPTKQTTEPEAKDESTLPKKGYQKIEDWEEEQQEKRKNGTMTWEERVQFEGQRQGDQVRQNDILMRQIKSGF